MSNNTVKRDARVRDYVMPVRIVWQENVSDAVKLLRDDDEACELRPGASVLLDYGRELHGGVQLDNGITEGKPETKVRVRFGESVTEAMSQPNNDHAIHDQVLPVAWFGATEIGNTGFRFVRLDVLEGALSLRRAQAVFLHYDIPQEGVFRCNDERLNDIWDTGAYTVRLCMQDYLWDGIKRDRLPWIGDMHPETMVISNVFGASDIVPKSLDIVRNRTPLPEWMNGISAYSLWWLIIQWDWYLYHGNRAYLEEQCDYIMGLLNQVLASVGEDGRENIEGWRFLDWPTQGDDSAIHAGLQALLCMALRASESLCHALDETIGALRCAEAVERMRTYQPGTTQSKQANALLAVSGLCDASAVNARSLATDPLHGLSTFYGYYVLQARAMAGDYLGALDVIRKYWGGMLDAGATTFWEHFELDWMKNAGRIDELTPDGKDDIHADFGDHCYVGLRHSLCHGWAAGPTAWMMEHILGVKPLEPGCCKLSVRPNLGDLRFADGRFPTPLGAVQIHHMQTDTGVESIIDAPDGIEVVR